MNEAFAKIVVPFAQRTSARKAGTTYLNLPDGTKVIVMANLLAPDHDRSLFEPTLEFLSRYRPHVIIFAGRIIHAKVVKLLDPSNSLAPDEDEAPLAPEVQAAIAHSQIFEERAIELFRRLGESVFKRVLQAAGPQCRLYYLPALDGGSAKNLPPEGTIRGDLQRLQKKVDAQRARLWRREMAAWRKDNQDETGPPPEPPEYAAIPMARRQFAELLQIHDEPRIKVLPFGSSITLRCQVSGGALTGQTAPDPRVLSAVRVDVGSRRVANPIMEAHTMSMVNDVSTILGYPPNLSSGWFTKSAAINTLNRKYLFFAQVGMMWRRERVDFGDTRIDRFASGFFVGHNCRGFLHGTSIPFVRGADGRRQAVVYADVISESEPGDLGRRDSEQISLD